MSSPHVAERGPEALARLKSGGRIADQRRGFALAVATLTVLGAAVRVVVAHQSLFADELSTYWIVTTHDLGGVVSTVHTNAEITPPLYFVLSWLSTKAGHGPEWVRAPSLLAGTLTVPIVYAIGVRTAGRAAALVATALTALSPFMIYYSAEARGYALMMALTAASTLALLRAVDRGRTRWWVSYAIASCGAAYSHYTCVFALGAQLVWVLWAHPEARRAALLANLGASLAFLPWITGLYNDLTSPTAGILSALSPFTPTGVRVALEHWTVGYPYSTLPLRQLPGEIGLVLLATGLMVALAGLLRRVATRHEPSPLGQFDRRLVLVGILAVSVPVGEAVVSAASTNLFGVRNLAASWPGFALVLAILLVAAGPRLRAVTVGLVLASFAIGAVKLVESRYGRPDYAGAVAYVERSAAPGDVVVDETGVLSPGPLTPLDTLVRRHLTVFRARAPAEHDHPFGFSDPDVDLAAAVTQAKSAARGGRLFVVGDDFNSVPAFALRRTATPSRRGFVGYRLLARRLFPGFVEVGVGVYGPEG
jgi:dolichyl-phosphate-mannose-protein mannosyltransferase